MSEKARIDNLIKQRIQAQAIRREAATQRVRAPRRQNAITVDFPLREALEVGFGPGLGILRSGTEGTIYLEELRMDSQISIPADRGHLSYAVTSTHKTNTDFAPGSFSYPETEARVYTNSEVLAGCNSDQLWSPTGDHNMVSQWPTRKITADQNLKGRFTRVDDTYTFGKGCTIGYHRHNNYQRPRAEDSGALGTRDCIFYDSVPLHAGATKTIKFRVDRDGNFKLDHDYFFVRRYGDAENTLVTDDVAYIQDTIYIRCSIVI